MKSSKMSFREIKDFIDFKFEESKSFEDSISILEIVHWFNFENKRLPMMDFDSLKKKIKMVCNKKGSIEGDIIRGMKSRNV